MKACSHRQSKEGSIIVTKKQVLDELSAIAFYDRTKIIKVNEDGDTVVTPTDRLSPKARKLISGIKDGKSGSELTLYDKFKALELLGKHLGMFSGNSENDSSESVRIVDDI